MIERNKERNKVWKGEERRKPVETESKTRRETVRVRERLSLKLVTLSRGFEPDRHI